MTTSIKRSLVKSFLNTGTILSSTWSLIGDGVASAKAEMNPEVSKQTYIHEDNASVAVESYAPTMPIEAIAKNGDEIFEYIDALRKGRDTLDDAETEIVNVWLYKDSALGYYVAEKQACSIQVENFGGDGGKAAMLAYTVNFIGDPTPGTFSPIALAFVDDPVLAILTTMVIGSVTLTPLFSANHSWLWYTGSVPNGTTTVTMTSTCTVDGATVVQKKNSTTIAQGDPASLSVGVNHLTITVTVGDEVVVYHIDITRAAA